MFKLNLFKKISPNADLLRALFLTRYPQNPYSRQVIGIGPIKKVKMYKIFVLFVITLLSSINGFGIQQSVAAEGPLTAGFRLSRGGDQNHLETQIGVLDNRKEVEAMVADFQQKAHVAQQLNPNVKIEVAFLEMPKPGRAVNAADDNFTLPEAASLAARGIVGTHAEEITLTHEETGRLLGHMAELEPRGLLNRSAGELGVATIRVVANGAIQYFGLSLFHGIPPEIMAASVALYCVPVAFFALNNIPNNNWTNHGVWVDHSLPDKDEASVELEAIKKYYSEPKDPLNYFSRVYARFKNGISLNRVSGEKPAVIRFTFTESLFTLYALLSNSALHLSQYTHKSPTWLGLLGAIGGSVLSQGQMTSAAGKFIQLAKRMNMSEKKVKVIANLVEAVYSVATNYANYILATGNNTEVGWIMFFTLAGTAMGSNVMLKQLLLSGNKKAVCENVLEGLQAVIPEGSEGAIEPSSEVHPHRFPVDPNTVHAQ